MKCKKCGGEIKPKAAKFCSFCGVQLEQKEELSGYTRAQFFGFTGDDEFRASWESLKSMSADEFLHWIRQKPPAHYVYRFYGIWPSDYRFHGRREYARCIYRNDIKGVNKIGKVVAKKYRLTCQILPRIGIDAFWGKEECEAAIREEIKNADELPNELDHT